MLHNLTRAAVPGYLAAKALWSLANDAWMWRTPRRPLPTFATPAAAWSYLEGKGNPYTGDPLGGAADSYLHPQRLQAALESGARDLPIDCDDVAGWALVACRAIPDHTARLVSLVDPLVVGSHVICVGTGPGLPWAIDVNGFRWLPDLAPATLCRVWSDIYGSTRFVAAYDSPYPW